MRARYRRSLAAAQLPGGYPAPRSRPGTASAGRCRAARTAWSPNRVRSTPVRADRRDQEW